MFNVGGAEMLVIMVVALLVLGPNKLPEAAKQAGKWMGELRKISTGFQHEMRQAMHEVSDPFGAGSNGTGTNGTAPSASADAADRPSLDKPSSRPSLEKPGDPPAAAAG